MNKRFIIYCFIFAVFVHALLSLYHIASTYAPDFSVFYMAATGFVAHQNIYTLPMYTGLGYPPFTLLPFLPITFLPYALAQTLWTIVSFGLLLLSSYLSLRLVKKNVTFFEFALISSFAFLAFPSKFTLGMGQINFLALALLLGSVWFWQKKKHLYSGIALGMLLIVKPHFFFLLPVYIVAGQWLTSFVGIGIVSLAAIVTGIVFGWQHYTYYLSVTVPPLTAFLGRDIYYNQSLGSMFTRLVPLQLASELTIWGSTLIIIAVLWFIWWKRLQLLEGVVVFIPIFLIVEPLSWQHHYVFLLPVFVWTVWKMKTKYILLITSYLLVAANVQNPAALDTIPLSGFLLSHVFWGNALLLGTIVWFLYKEKKLT